MTKLDKDYQKIPRSKELIKHIESYWARPLKMCNKSYIDIAETHYINIQMIKLKHKLINSMYLIK
jgi:hypothetical protein